MLHSIRLSHLRRLAVGAASTGGLLWLAQAARAATEALPEPSPVDLLRDWSFDPTVQLPLLMVALGYVVAVRRIDARHPANPVPRSHVIAFLAGLATIEFALQGVVGTYDDVLFGDHMLQHVLLMMVAAPLLVLGAPVTTVLRAATPAVRTRWLLPILHSRSVRLLSHPAVGFVLFAGVLWGTHFSGIYELSLENQAVHDLEHLAYLTIALIFWWPVVGRDPAPWRLPHLARLLLMLLQMVQSAFLGVVILMAPAPLYAHYAELNLGWITPLADQQLAGGIMWVVGGLGFLLLSLLVVLDWMVADEREAARIDARLDRARELGARLDLAAPRGADPPAPSGEGG